jgi:hypothetical protein
MTAQDHPLDTALLAFAAGTVDEAQRAEIAAHVSGCANCRAFVRAMEHVGGAVLDGLPPAPLASGSLAEVLAQLHEPASSAAPFAGARPSKPAVISSPPRGLRWLNGRMLITPSHLKAGWATAALVILGLGVAYLAADYFRYADDFAASTATTGTVAIGGSTAGNIERAGDADWFKVRLTRGTIYRFQLEGSDTAQGTLQYPVLRLLDSTGYVLHTDSGSVDGPGPGLTSVLHYSAASTGTYYLSSEARGNDSGTYKVSAIEVSLSPNQN